MGAYDFTQYTPLGQRARFRRFTKAEGGLRAGPRPALRRAGNQAVNTLFLAELAARFLRPRTSPLGRLGRFSADIGCALEACSGACFIGRRSDHTLTAPGIIGAYRGAW